MKATWNELDLATCVHRNKSRDNVCLAVITRLFDYRGLNKDDDTLCYVTSCLRNRQIVMCSTV